MPGGASVERISVLALGLRRGTDTQNRGGMGGGMEMMMRFRRPGRARR